MSVQQQTKDVYVYIHTFVCDGTLQGQAGGGGGGGNREAEAESRRRREEMKNAMLAQILDQNARARCALYITK